MNNNSKLKTVAFPQGLYELITKRAESKGLTVEEYVTNLVKKDLGVEKKPVKKLTTGKYFFAKDEEDLRRGL